MFILKSTHESLVQAFEKRWEEMLKAKDEQIADLRRLVFVPTPTHAETLSIRAANAILDGQEVMPTQDPAQEALDMAEANRILSGDYDRFEDSV